MKSCFFHGLESDGPGRKGGHLASLGWDLYAPTINYRDPESVRAAWTDTLAAPRDAFVGSSMGGWMAALENISEAPPMATSPWEGIYLGDQSGYFLTKPSGEPMVINGNKIPVPGSTYTITMTGLGIEVMQVAKDASMDPALYIGTCLVDAQTDSMAQLSCTCKEQSSSKYPAEPKLALAINLTDQTMVVNGDFGPEFTGIKQ